jgi:hypothetical protein
MALTCCGLVQSISLVSHTSLLMPRNNEGLFFPVHAGVCLDFAIALARNAFWFPSSVTRNSNILFTNVSRGFDLHF